MAPVPKVHNGDVSGFRRSRAFAPWVFALSAGCSICGTESDQGQLVFSFDLNVDPFAELRSGGAVLEGTLLCLDNVEVADASSSSATGISLSSEWWSECVEITAEGPQSLDEDGCFVFDAGPGEVTINLREQTCSVESGPFLAGEFVDDSLRVEVVQAATVAARLDPGSIERYLEAEAHPGPAGEWPVDWIPSADAPLQVIAGEIIALPVTLWQGEGSGSIVAWDTSDGALTVVHGADSGVYTAQWAPGEFEATLMVDETVTVDLDRQGHHWEVGALRAVDIGAAASIELVAAYTPLSDEELEDISAGAPRWGPPLGIRAVVRDADDRILRAAPVAWELVDGAMYLQDLQLRLEDAETETEPEDLPLARHQAYLIPAEYLQVDASSCVAPEPAPVVRHATIMATVNGQEASLDLEWSELAREAGEEPFVAPEPCTIEGEGCGCRSSGDAPGALLLGLVALGLRRRRSAPGGAAPRRRSR